MLEALQHKLRLSANFPSPPAIALQIIALAGEPDVDLAKVATAISKDPGLTAKILRVANSPLYSKRRKSENLRQALINLGLNSATTLALSFSLVTTYKSGQSGGIDYAHFWRRAILCASAARTVGAMHGAGAPDDLFLAALLQDIVVLAIDRAQADFYAQLPANAPHAEVIAHERRILGSDHAILGGWLMRQWKLPDSICAIVESSHEPTVADAATPIGVAARCVALASDCVEVLLAPQGPTELHTITSHAHAWLGLDSAALAALMAGIVAEIPEIERLFDTALIDADSATAILDQARDLLTFRSMQALDQMSRLNENVAHLQARTVALEDKGRRDALTGVFNRGHLDEVLEQEFHSANGGGWPLSIVFADLDRFKLVNDTYGHPAGDAVLVATAQMIVAVMRDEDCVARYGGEEFVIVLPGIGADAAQNVCERLLARLRAARHAVAGGMIQATASLGLATHCAMTPFPDVTQLIQSADRCVYAAKKAGRDRLVCFTPTAVAATG